jgi:hypothetical protein
MLRSGAVSEVDIAAGDVIEPADQPAIDVAGVQHELAAGIVAIKRAKLALNGADIEIGLVAIEAFQGWLADSDID